MAAKAKEEKPAKGLMYKGKALLRKGNQIYYGNSDDKYIISMKVRESTQIMEVDVSTNVLVELITNAAPGHESVIKKAERDGIYTALDLGEFWLHEALAE